MSLGPSWTMCCRGEHHGEGDHSETLAPKSVEGGWSRMPLGASIGHAIITGTAWESCWNMFLPNPAQTWFRSLEVVLLVVVRVGRKSGESVPMTSARFGGTHQAAG